MSLLYANLTVSSKNTIIDLGNDYKIHDIDISTDMHLKSEHYASRNPHVTTIMWIRDSPSRPVLEL